MDKYKELLSNKSIKMKDKKVIDELINNLLNTKRQQLI